MIDKKCYIIVHFIMILDGQSLKRLCGERRMSLQRLLKKANVSRTAYYSLLRKDTVLPKSIDRISKCLGVSPGVFLQDPLAQIQRIRELDDQADRIQRRYPECDRDVVLRTLRNLDLEPVERLRRALIRAPKTNIRR
jgi:transcriptional regulator with XRE-family HTH domain